MAEAKRDKNSVTTLLAISSVDNVTPVTLWADPVTHRLLVDSAGGGGTPAGPDTSVQFNFGGAFAGDAGLTFDKDNNILAIGAVGDGNSAELHLVNDVGSEFKIFTDSVGNGTIETFNQLTLNSGNGEILSFGSIIMPEVGAGTYKLLINKDVSDSDALVQIKGAGVNGQSGIKFTNTDYGNWILYTGVGSQDSIGIYSYTLSTDVFVFAAVGGFGKMGIFQSYPAYTLDVGGDGHYTTDLTVDGNVNALAQANVYNDVTIDPGDYQRLAMYLSGDIAFIRAENITSNPIELRIGTENDTALSFFTQDIIRWSVSSSGFLLAGADASYDIGASGGSRPRDIYVSANVFSADEAYGSSWNGSTAAPTKNAIYDKIQTMSSPVATSDLTAQSAAIAATTIYAVPSTGQGRYRISWVATITTAASTSSVLGGAGGFQSIFTSPTDSVVKTENPTNITSSAGNTTATTVSGNEVVYAKASTNIQYKFGYTSVGVTAMVYELHIVVETL